MLALLVPDITNPHNFGLIRGAEAQARAAGHTLVLGDTQESAQFEQALTERLGSAVDGLVLAASRRADADLRELQRRRPVVLYIREISGFPSVVTDSVDGSRQIVEHLVALGHRSIAYFAGPPTSWSDAERWRALSTHAQGAHAAIVRLGPFSPTLDHGSAATDLALATSATALVAYNDLLAIGMLRGLAHRGVDIPTNISVVGYDDIFGADFCHPPLTTVASPAEQAGRSLIDLLLESHHGQRDLRIVLPTHLRVRDSTGPAPS
jgi:DNA-binding LacI/PurR family transcriptional regulator